MKLFILLQLSLTNMLRLANKSFIYPNFYSCAKKANQIPIFGKPSKEHTELFLCDPNDRFLKLDQLSVRNIRKEAKAYEVFFCNVY